MPNKVFDKTWFAEHQTILVWLASSWLGELLFGFKKMGHYVDHTKIAQITPNSVTEFVQVKDNKVEFRAHFFNRNEYARRLYFALLPMWWVMHFWDWLLADRFVPAWSFGFSTLTVNPQAAPASTAADATVLHLYGSGAGQNWATITAAAGTAVEDLNDNGVMEIRSDSGSGNWRRLRRSIFCFDTSALTSAASISAAVMSLFGSAKSDGLAVTPDVNIFTSTPANPASIVAGDYAQIGTTAQATAITYSNWSTVTWNDFTLNGTGLGNISKTGVTKFATANGNYDGARSSPTWSASLISDANCTMADNASNKPKLVITYTTATGLATKFLLMGTGL